MYLSKNRMVNNVRNKNMAKKAKKKTVKKTKKAAMPKPKPEPAIVEDNVIADTLPTASTVDAATYTNCRNCGKVQAGCPECSQSSVSNCPFCGYKR